MIGLDTNVVVRYLIQDGAVQSAKATELFERGLSEEEPGFVSVVARVETAWVLERVYGLTGEELAAAIERMLEVNVLIVESEQEIFSAMIAVKEGRGSFADALIGALGAKVGCSHTVTFDQKTLRPSGPYDRLISANRLISFETVLSGSLITRWVSHSTKPLERPRRGLGAVWAIDARRDREAEPAQILASRHQIDMPDRCAKRRTLRRGSF